MTTQEKARLIVQDIVSEKGDNPVRIFKSIAKKEYKVVVFTGNCESNHLFYMKYRKTVPSISLNKQPPYVHAKRNLIDQPQKHVYIFGMNKC